jgi:hypothetical protein
VALAGPDSSSGPISLALRRRDSDSAPLTLALSPLAAGAGEGSEALVARVLEFVTAHLGDSRLHVQLVQQRAAHADRHRQRDRDLQRAHLSLCEQLLVLLRSAPAAALRGVVRAKVETVLDLIQDLLSTPSFVAILQVSAVSVCFWLGLSDPDDICLAGANRSSCSTRIRWCVGRLCRSSMLVWRSIASTESVSHRWSNLSMLSAC